MNSFQSWLSIAANIGIVVGLILVAFQINQESESNLRSAVVVGARQGRAFQSLPRGVRKDLSPGSPIRA